jgi:hypothetical protein
VSPQRDESDGIGEVHREGSDLPLDTFSCYCSASEPMLLVALTANI